MIPWKDENVVELFRVKIWNVLKVSFVKLKVEICKSKSGFYRTMGRWWWHQLCHRCSWKSQTFPSLTLEPTCKGFFHVYFKTAALSFETWFEVCLPHLLVRGLREGKHGDWRRPCTSLNIFARLKQEGDIYWGKHTCQIEKQWNRLDNIVEETGRF